MHQPSAACREATEAPSNKSSNETIEALLKPADRWESLFRRIRSALYANQVPNRSSESTDVNLQFIENPDVITRFRIFGLLLSDYKRSSPVLSNGNSRRFSSLVDVLALQCKRENLEKITSERQDGDSSTKHPMELDRSLSCSSDAIGFVFLLENRRTGRMAFHNAENLKSTSHRSRHPLLVGHLCSLCSSMARLSIQARLSEPETVSLVARARRGLRRDLLGIGVPC